MSSTNKTTNLELSQFIGSDSPKWLTDYNGDMEKIDTGYQTIKAQADATDLVVGGHTSSINTLQSTTTDQGTAITQLRTDVNGNSGSINTINSLIGNGEPTTTDKTLIGAINEIYGDLGSLQIDGIIGITVTADGVKTLAEILQELITNAKTAAGAKGLIIKDLFSDYISIAHLACERTYLLTSDTATLSLGFTDIDISVNNNSVVLKEITISLTGANYYHRDIIDTTTGTHTISDQSDRVPDSGRVFRLDCYRIK